MLNDTTFDYLIEFYGNSAQWFAIYILSVSFFTVISHLFFIILTLTTQSLRQHVANWFLLGFSLSDLLHSTAHLVDGYAILKGTINDRFWCRIAGIFTVSTAACSLGFPALLAAARYYKITKISQSSAFSIGKAIFSERMTLPLIVGWCFLSIILNLPLMLNDAFGEDPSGFCGTKKFTSVPLFLSFEFSIIFIYAGSLMVTAIYYYQLVKWLKSQAIIRNSQDSVDYTSGVMRVTKIVTLLPLLSVTPAAILTSGQMILPALPMWINRLLIAPYLLSSAANPWLTIALIRPFRDRFLQLESNVKNAAPRYVEKLNNRSRIAPKI